MMMNFKDKTILVTGGTSGIGKACAIAFTKCGGHVIVVARKDTHQGIACEVDKLGSANFLNVDVSSPKKITTLFEVIADTYQKIDIAINCAGIAGAIDKTLHQFSEQEWDEVLDINLKGLWLCMKHEIALMLGKGGAIVNISSVGGLRAGRVSAAYTASKHGVVGLTKAAALEYSKDSIRINAVCPAFIDTPMLSGLIEIKEKASQVIPVGRCGSPEEIASTVLWLCSEYSSFITGVALPIDGGLSA